MHNQHTTQTDLILWDSVLTLFWETAEYSLETADGYPMIFYKFEGMALYISANQPDWFGLYVAIRTDPNLQDVEHRVWERFPEAEQHMRNFDLMVT